MRVQGWSESPLSILTVCGREGNQGREKIWSQILEIDRTCLYWFLHKLWFCTVPMGLRSELIEFHFPTLKRGANKLCASGARVH